ncbi:flagellar biosynthetic protein FliO [Kosakonia sacchari]|uniref:flagellar biosynthetic protein FliO n=1 Tax=Kosakonia sacchari TaxID=1158459 RepID=UPI002ACECC9E|nr:flagellar biosynthetic protein FliO [Kosakonia sacchari]MDZ7323030.1 flagellar biosynthetic protein FliO [Kosakonia sacchari]
MNTPTINTVQPVAGGPAVAPVSIGNVVGALALVLLLIVAMAWICRRTGVASRMVKGNSILSVKHTQSLGARQRLVVVEVDDKWLLLGVTQENITNLMTMEKKADAEPVQTAPFAASFQAALVNRITRYKGEGKK